jgi:hypothetical protein
MGPNKPAKRHGSRDHETSAAICTLARALARGRRGPTSQPSLCAGETLAWYASTSPQMWQSGVLPSDGPRLTA